MPSMIFQVVLWGYIAICTTEVRRCEDFFCWHIWQNPFALCIDSAADSQTWFLGKPSVKSVPGAVSEGCKLFFIEHFCLALEDGCMFFPSLNGIFFIDTTEF